MTKAVDTIVCPYCNSYNVITKKKAGYVIMFSILLLGLPLPFFKKSLYCFDCGKEWKIQKNKNTQ